MIDDVALRVIGKVDRSAKCYILLAKRVPAGHVPIEGVTKRQGVEIDMRRRALNPQAMFSA